MDTTEILEWATNLRENDAHKIARERKEETMTSQTDNTREQQMETALVTILHDLTAWRDTEYSLVLRLPDSRTRTHRNTVANYNALITVGQAALEN